MGDEQQENQYYESSEEQSNMKRTKCACLHHQPNKYEQDNQHHHSVCLARPVPLFRMKELFVGRLKIFPDEKRKVLAKKSGRIESLVREEEKLLPEIWLRQNDETEMNERIGNIQRTTPTVVAIEFPDTAQKANELLMKTAKKFKNYEGSNNYSMGRCSSLRKSTAILATPILLLISLILPLASSNSTPPSPQTIEGKQRVIEIKRVINRERVSLTTAKPLLLSRIDE